MSELASAAVAAMSADAKAPTAPLWEFWTAYRDDDNEWWRIGCGHHQNLYEEAMDRLAALNAIVSRWEREAIERGPSDSLYTAGAAAMLRQALGPATLTAEGEPAATRGTL